MKTIVAICVVLAVALAHPKDTYNTKYDDFNAHELVENPRLLKTYLLCFLEKGKCTNEGKEFRETIPDALKTECEKCTPKQRILIKTVVAGFQEKFPKMWEELVGKYDPNNEYKEGFDRFLNSPQ